MSKGEWSVVVDWVTEKHMELLFFLISSIDWIRYDDDGVTK